MAINYKDKLQHITTFCFDYDGVFTDGVMILLDNGSVARTAHVRDGYAVQLAAKKGFRILVITGGNQEAVRGRFEGLGVSEVFLGCRDKSKTLAEYKEAKGLKKEEILYMGDDIPDYKAIQEVGLACCPADAVPEIKSVVDYISPVAGGRGCVRDVIEQTLKAQDKWLDQDSHEW